MIAEACVIRLRECLDERQQRGHGRGVEIVESGELIGANADAAGSKRGVKYIRHGSVVDEEPGTPGMPC